MPLLRARDDHANKIRHLDHLDHHDHNDANDLRVETSSSSSASSSSSLQPPSQPLRPLTSEARLGHRRPSLDAAMPPIYPAPLSVQHQQNQQNQHQQHQQPTPVAHRTFLPQLAGLPTRSFAIGRATDTDTDTEPTVDEDTEDFKRAMWAGQANILVTVRVRPHCAHDRGAQEIVRVLDNKLIVVLDKHQQPATAGVSPQRGSAMEPVTAAMLLQPRRSVAGATVGHGSHGLRKLRTVASAHPARATAGKSHGSGNNNNNQSTPSRSREKRYAFDYVFTPTDGQQTVYHHTTKFLIHGVLNGFNATVFAYGCTGAGKTYTMLGTPDEPGIMALTLDDLFQNIARVHADAHAAVAYKVTVSFLEVYNENIRDLLATTTTTTTTTSFGGSGALSPAASSGPSTSGGGGGGGGGSNEFLDLREDPVKGPVVAGISEVEASNAQEVMKLLRRGNKHRSQEATAANAVSSRSHAVLQVLVEQREKHSSSEAFGVDAARGGTMTSTVKYGKLSLVDLAGSERAAVTQNRGQRLIEGANINRSLLALGNCINALGEKGAGAASGGFVPYRDSKLTRLLKDSLGGNCRTVMIANVSPATASVEETLNTLKYANRAKNIKTTVTRNVLNVDHHLTEYAGVVAELKDEIATLKKQLARQSSGSGNSNSSTALSPSGFLASRLSPGRSRFKERRGTNNDDRSGEHERDDDAWKHAKLAEARGYIAQCFQQRQHLRQSLLEMDHCIDELARQLRLVVDATAVGPETTESRGGESKTNVKVPTERQRDLATSILEDIVGDTPHQQSEDVTHDTEALPPQHARLEAGLRQLVARKTHLVSQLERNQSVMDDFRLGIEQSPLFETNELLRDVLLMEYRVGELQVENAVAAGKQVLTDHEMARLRARLAGHATPDTSLLCRTLTEMPSLDLPAPCTDMTRLLSASQSTRDSDETPEVTSTRSSTGFAFLDDLRDRFYHDRSKQQQPLPQSQIQHEQQQLHANRPLHENTKTATGTGGSNTGAGAGGLSPRRQWGIHLTNTSLPYIRLKKKPAPPTVVAASTIADPLTLSEYASSTDDPTVLQHTAAATTTAAPYLKVLKHRRKQLQHRNSTSSSSSHKKLPGLLQPVSS